MYVYSFALTVFGAVNANYCYPSLDSGWTNGSGPTNTNARFTITGSTPGGTLATTEFYDSSPYYYHQFIFTNGAGFLDPEFSDEVYYMSCSCSLAVNEHEIWGAAWTQNTYINNAGSFNNHTTPSTCVVVAAGCPSSSFIGGHGLAMYWENGKYPGNSGSNGGTLDTCLYQQTYGSYLYCTIGGEKAHAYKVEHGYVAARADRIVGIV